MEHERSYPTAVEPVFLILYQLADFSCLLTGQKEVGHLAFVYLQKNGCQSMNIALHPPGGRVLKCGMCLLAEFHKKRNELNWKRFGGPGFV